MKKWLLPAGWRRRFRRPRSPEVLVLAYHRIAECHRDPNLLCVSPDNFQAQLDVIRSRWNPIPIEEIADRIGDRSGTGLSIVVTFDDGYRDNLHTAEPILRRAGVPATVFLTAGYVGSGREYWWEELEGIVFDHPSRARTIHAVVEGISREWHLSPAEDPSLAGSAAWNVLIRDDLTPRQAAYLELAEILKYQTDDDRVRILGELGALGRPVRIERTCMDAHEIGVLSEGGMFTIGAHTMTHPCLSALSEGAQREEIESSRQVVESLAGGPVRSFAYPYGGRDDIGLETPSLVEESGFELACTTSSGLVRSSSDRFRLPRMVVRDWEASEFQQRVEAILA